MKKIKITKNNYSFASLITHKNDTHRFGIYFSLLLPSAPFLYISFLCIVMINWNQNFFFTFLWTMYISDFLLLLTWRWKFQLFKSILSMALKKFYLCLKLDDGFRVCYVFFCLQAIVFLLLLETSIDISKISCFWE